MIHPYYSKWTKWCRVSLFICSNLCSTCHFQLICRHFYIGTCGCGRDTHILYMYKYIDMYIYIYVSSKSYIIQCWNCGLELHGTIPKCVVSFRRAHAISTAHTQMKTVYTHIHFRTWIEITRLFWSYHHDRLLSKHQLCRFNLSILSEQLLSQTKDLILYVGIVSDSQLPKNTRHCVW